jgi:hypothetical protein
MSYVRWTPGRSATPDQFKDGITRAAKIRCTGTAPNGAERYELDGPYDEETGRYEADVVCCDLTDKHLDNDLLSAVRKAGNEESEPAHARVRYDSEAKQFKPGHA